MALDLMGFSDDDWMGFDSFFQDDPVIDTAPVFDTRIPDLTISPTRDTLTGANFWYHAPEIEDVFIDPSTLSLTRADGSPLPSPLEQAIRETFALPYAPAAPDPFSSSDPTLDQYDPTYTPPEALADPQRFEQAVAEEQGLAQGARQVQNGQDPGKDWWDKLNGFLVKTQATPLNRLATTAVLSAVGLIANGLFTKTAKLKDPFKGGSSAMQNPLFQQAQGSLGAALSGGGASDLTSAIGSNLAGQREIQGLLAELAARERAASAAEAPAAAAVRAKALADLVAPYYGSPILGKEYAQLDRVLSGNYSNALLDEQARQEQETLENAMYKAGGRDYLAQSAPGQRAQMYQDLKTQISRENDRRATLGQLLPDTLTRETTQLNNRMTAANFGRTSPTSLVSALQNTPGSAYLNLSGLSDMDRARAQFQSGAAATDYNAQNQSNANISNTIAGILSAIRGTMEPAPGSPATPATGGIQPLVR